MAGGDRPSMDDGDLGTLVEVAAQGERLTEAGASAAPMG